MNKKTAIKLTLMILSVFGAGLGIALSIKANIGITSYDAFNTVMSQLFSIKVGTMTIIANLSCIFIQLVFLRKNFELRRLFQVVLTFFIGYVINFFLYTVLEPITLHTYLAQLLVFLAGQTICAVGIGVLLAVNYSSFPLEPMLMVVADTFNWQFAKVRQLFDVITAIVTILICFMASIPLPFREGSIIGIIIFTPILHRTFTFMKQWLGAGDKRIQ